jgi:hypothetical protein
MAQTILMIVPISACFIAIPDYYFTKEEEQNKGDQS